MTTPEEQEVIDDEQALPQPDAEAAPSETEYIEFVGQEPYGTEFYRGDAGTHTVFKAEMKKYHDIDLGAKEIVWKRGANGRFLVPTSDMTPEAAKFLAADPMFKRVTLSN